MPHPNPTTVEQVLENIEWAEALVRATHPPGQDYWKVYGALVIAQQAAILVALTTRDFYQ